MTYKPGKYILKFSQVAGRLYLVVMVITRFNK